MTMPQSIYHTYKRYRTLQTDIVHALPIAILMPHSACNCRCVMCDIWKDNKNLKQLEEKDISSLLASFKKLGTTQVVMSGGEALLNPNFFTFCKMLKTHGIRITLLSTGLTLKKHAPSIVKYVGEVIVSLDGDEATHNYIRNIPGAYARLAEGINEIRSIHPNYRITGRTVIHKINFRVWPNIIESAMALGLNQVSFLPADVSSHAFNREVLWSDQRQHEVLPDIQELSILKNVLESVIERFPAAFETKFIAEDKNKLRKIATYYEASYGLTGYPYKKCNAPWVSTVVEADGTVRPCFFHASIGNIRQASLENILNGDTGMNFRRNLDMDSNPTCKKCVCHLHVSPSAKI